MLNKSGSSAASTTSLEQFVYADVAPEPNGMSLSVLSALARRGLDPWQEARRLAELPAPAAVDRLAKTLVGLPLMRSSLDDATAIAGRLVALLPPAPDMASVGMHTADGVRSITAAPRWMMLGMAAALVMGLMAPLFGTKGVPTVAPASWLTNGPEEHVSQNFPPAHGSTASPTGHTSEAGRALTTAPSTVPPP
jgi:hypothetical protein